MARPPNPEAPRRLLEAARRVFARLGVDNARIQDIAHDAGFSKAAFYLYFDSKEQVYEQLMAALFESVSQVTNERHQVFQEMVARLGRCGPSDFRTGSERLTAFAELDHEYNKRVLVALWEHRDVFGCVLEQATGDRRLIADRFTDISRATLVGRLGEAMAAGFLRQDLDAELAADMMIGAWMQLARRMVRMDQPPDFEHWARQIDRFVTEGLGCRPGIPVAPEHA